MSSFLAAPSYLWNSYINYLWNYDSNSWVATIAYAFRIWAILAILPTLVLALLDVTSYVIARTLGDPTASTSHKSSFVTQLSPKSESKIANIDTSAPPTTLAIPVPVTVLVPPPQGEPPSGISTKPTPAPTPTPSTGATSPRAFFVDGEGSEDDGAARLAGVGVFSPVASMPGSPTVSRRNLLEKEGEDDGGGGIASGSDESGSSSVAPRGVLLQHQHQHQHRHQNQNHHHGGREAETETEGGHDGHEHAYGHERAASDGGGVNGGGSTSGESSFAMLDHEDSFEDAGVHIRRRVPGVAAADE